MARDKSEERQEGREDDRWYVKASRVLPKLNIKAGTRSIQAKAPLGSVIQDSCIECFIAGHGELTVFHLNCDVRNRFTVLIFIALTPMALTLHQSIKHMMFYWKINQHLRYECKENLMPTGYSMASYIHTPCCLHQSNDSVCCAPHAYCARPVM